MHKHDPEKDAMEQTILHAATSLLELKEMTNGDGMFQPPHKPITSVSGNNMPYVVPGREGGPLSINSFKPPLASTAVSQPIAECSV